MEKVYNVASGHSPTSSRVHLCELHEVIKTAIEPRLEAKPYTSGPVMRLEADITKLQREVGGATAWTLAAGVKEIARQLAHTTK